MKVTHKVQNRRGSALEQPGHAAWKHFAFANGLLTSHKLAHGSIVATTPSAGRIACFTIGSALTS